MPGRSGQRPLVVGEVGGLHPPGDAALGNQPADAAAGRIPGRIRRKILRMTSATTRTTAPRLAQLARVVALVRRHVAVAWFRASAHASALDRWSLRCGTISRVTSRPAAAQHLRDLARLRRVRDRIDREYAQPLDVEARARGAHMSAGHLSRE